MPENARLVQQFSSGEPQNFIDFEAVRHSRTSRADHISQSYASRSHAADESRLRADRRAGQRPRFLTVELSRGWLSEEVRGHEAILNRETQGFLGGEARLRTARESRLILACDAAPSKCSSRHAPSSDAKSGAARFIQPHFSERTSMTISRLYSQLAPRTCCGTTAQRPLKRHQSGDGCRLFEPQPFFQGIRRMLGYARRLSASPKDGAGRYGSG